MPEPLDTKEILMLRAMLQRLDWDEKKGPRTKCRIAICNIVLVKITSTMCKAAVDGILAARIRCAEIASQLPEGLA